jgi:hypothetical protein
LPSITAHYQVQRNLELVGFSVSDSDVVCGTVLYALTAESLAEYSSSPAKCAWYVHPVWTVLGAFPEITNCPVLSDVVQDVAFLLLPDIVRQ